LDGVDSALPGGKGLLQVDEIMVKQSKDNLAPLACRDNTTGGVSVGDYTCLPSGMNSADSAFFGRLETYIAGTGNCDTASPGDNCVDGWYRDFYPYLNRERNLGQATLLSGLVTIPPTNHSAMPARRREIRISTRCISGPGLLVRKYLR